VYFHKSKTPDSVHLLFTFNDINPHQLLVL
jgi:hypothetical protein